MKHNIVSRWDSSQVLFSAEIHDDPGSGMAVRVALEAATAVKANLYGADLGGANLYGANLGGRKLVGDRPVICIGPIGSRNDYLLAFLTDAGVMIQAGCFLGTRSKFELQLASTHGDNKHAQTRFIQIGLAGSTVGKSGKPVVTGRDKTSVIVELPSDRPGALLELLEQFATRGVNLSRIESRPIGDRLGRYRFNIDAQGHISDEAVAEALKGLHRFSPNVLFLGSYPRADKQKSVHEGNNSNPEFGAAEAWFKSL